MAWFNVVVVIFGVLMSVANLPQAYKIFKRKSAKDISPITYSIFSLGSLVWLIYGIEQQNNTIIIAYGPGVISASLVLAGWFVYGDGKKK